MRICSRMPENDQFRQPVCAVIAAHNAEGTIAKAVASALAQAEVGEVVVVDDASSDRTCEMACAAANGDPRLKTLALDRNAGPAAARNMAVRASVSPLIAILDADDIFVPGRFTHLLAIPEWDLIADNIAFVTDTDRDEVPPGEAGLDDLSLAAFTLGNLSRSGVDRGELGFLKPVIRRSFIERHDLLYDAGMRLGEDFDLYVRCLLKGARFRVSHRVGYVAQVRGGSLSARHRTSDLKRLLDATDRHLNARELTADSRAALAALRKQTSRRHVLREFLDLKAAVGLRKAASFALSQPGNLEPIVRGILSDKTRAFRRQRPGAGVRTLLPPTRT